ncbi:hypothetical protein [Curtobacterium sp. MCBD17_040]|uniref:hypothetical protein n=1 Tax=Curtobacterium sp. MCBD17_040 TaxID=2175674 RepID=UPI000DA79EA5|nr:hypothetical protein [Curtobacterium sp. MCBD17_040]WIB65917.1 hypothetical protein DEI94_17530 [Curtobacterium sp. MCBD17_040]
MPTIAETADALLARAARLDEKAHTRAGDGASKLVAAAADLRTAARGLRDAQAFQDEFAAARDIEYPTEMDEAHGTNAYPVYDHGRIEALHAKVQLTSGPRTVNGTVRDDVAKALACRDRFAWGSLLAEDKDWYREFADKTIAIVRAHSA